MNKSPKAANIVLPPLNQTPTMTVENKRSLKQFSPLGTTNTNTKKFKNSGYWSKVQKNSTQRIQTVLESSGQTTGISQLCTSSKSHIISRPVQVKEKYNTIRIEGHQENDKPLNDLISTSSLDSSGYPKTYRQRDKQISKVFQDNFKYLMENDFFSHATMGRNQSSNKMEALTNKNDPIDSKIGKSISFEVIKIN